MKISDIHNITEQNKYKYPVFIISRANQIFNGIFKKEYPI